MTSSLVSSYQRAKISYLVIYAWINQDQQWCHTSFSNKSKHSCWRMLMRRRIMQMRPWENSCWKLFRQTASLEIFPEINCGYKNSWCIFACSKLPVRGGDRYSVVHVGIFWHALGVLCYFTQHGEVSSVHSAMLVAAWPHFPSLRRTPQALS